MTTTRKEAYCRRCREWHQTHKRRLQPDREIEQHLGRYGSIWAGVMCPGSGQRVTREREVPS